MEPALQRRVQRYGWDKAAQFYEAYWQKQLLPAQEKLLQLANIQPGKKVLETACGTGLVSFPIAELVGEKGFVFATDISDKMVGSCSAAANEKNLFNVKFERMDAEELDVDDESFDIAVCALGLMYVPDPLKAMKEMHRILKPGGRAAVAVWGKRSNCGWAEIFEIVDKRVTSEVCPMFFNLGNPGVMELNLTAAGFANISVERIDVKLLYKTPEEACGAAFAGGPVALPYNKFSDAVKNEVHQEYLESIEMYKNRNGYEVPGEFVVALSYKK